MARFATDAPFGHALGMCLLGVIRAVSATRPGSFASRLGAAVIGLYLLQLLIGVLNVAFLAPLPLQMAHLLFADLAWVALVLFTANALGGDGTRPGADRLVLASGQDASD